MAWKIDNPMNLRLDVWLNLARPKQNPISDLFAEFYLNIDDNDKRNHDESLLKLNIKEKF